MKVLGIYGSPRKGGNTDILLEEALKGAAEDGAEVEHIHLSTLNVLPCLECHGCDATGQCVVQDDMQSIYPKLTDSDVIILASPVFFYGITAWAKAMVDRSQALWTRKYLVKDPSLTGEAPKRKGFFISVGATKGGKLFDGAVLTMKYFWDSIHVRYAGELLFKGIEAKGEVLKHPEALTQALEAGKKLVRDP